MIKFGSLVSFLASILYYFALLTTSTLSDVLFSAAAFSINLGVSCYSAALLPFLTDQLIGASSDELSTVIHWFYWSLNFGHCLTDVTVYLVSNYVNVGIGLVIIFAIPLAVIIISDCLCQQWLDRTHKVTNPIKLIIQVLNYTRKHSYPERRSAFTYIDEEQLTTCFPWSMLGSACVLYKVSNFELKYWLFPQHYFVYLTSSTSSSVKGPPNLSLP